MRTVALLLVLGASTQPRLFAQAPPNSRDGLLGVDRQLSEAAYRDGLRTALNATVSEDVALVYPGAPVLTGRDTVAAFLRAQPTLDSIGVQWQALDAAVSGDGTLGVTFGLMIVSAPTLPAGPARIGRYFAAWRWVEARWRLVGFAPVGLVPANRTVVRPEFGPVERPFLPRAGRLAPVIGADLDFAALAGRAGAAKAFAAFAAPDAFTFGGAGELVRGPAAIGAAVGGGPPSHWSWAPVIAQLAGSGDLGFTIGQAVIRTDGQPPVYSKYLTVWRRGPDGRMRFLTDGGNARPKP